MAAATKVANAATEPVNVKTEEASTTPALWLLIPFKIEASNVVSVSSTTPARVKNLSIACAALMTSVEPSTSWKVSILAVSIDVTSNLSAVFSISVMFKPSEVSE